MLRLIKYVNGQAEGAYQLEVGRSCVIGRRADSNIQLDDPKISRHHCRIASSGDGWEVQDLDSTNGTYINRIRVRRGELKPGDLLLVGTTIFEVVMRETPASAARSVPRGEPDPPATAAPAAAEPTALRHIDGPAHATARQANGEAARCSQCGKALLPEAFRNGQATKIDGNVYCFACSINLELRKPAGDDDLFGLLREFDRRPGQKPDAGQAPPPQEPSK